MTADKKLADARRWLAQREVERGRHRYIPGMPSVLLPVMQRAVARVQERGR